MKKKFVVWLLHYVESLYLRSFGWSEIGVDQWRAPDGYGGRAGTSRVLVKGHALNSQRFYERHGSVKRLLAKKEK